MEIDQEAAIARFMSLARSWHERRLPAAEVFPEMVEFFRNVRIIGAYPNDDNDMMLFQWGAGRHLIFNEPTDIREISHAQLDYDQSEVRFLDFTRQVFVPEEDEEDDFDGVAIHMNVTFVYGSAIGDDDDGNLWVTLNKGDEGLRKFTSKPFVSQLMNAEPARYVSLVGYVG
jgi:hypothetical protein